jgi:hypothetical protein
MKLLGMVQKQVLSIGLDGLLWWDSPAGDAGVSPVEDLRPAVAPADFGAEEPEKETKDQEELVEDQEERDEDAGRERPGPSAGPEEADMEMERGESEVAFKAASVLPDNVGSNSKWELESDSGSDDGDVVTESLSVWAFTSDAGSDIQATRRRMESTAAPILFVLFLMCDCLLHQFHIITAEALHCMDFIFAALGLFRGRKKGAKKLPKKYYSILSMICHTWRENCPEIEKAWKELFPDGWKVFLDGKWQGWSAEDAAGRIPPKPIAGRWGRASACEAFLLIGCLLGTDFESKSVLVKMQQMYAVFRRVLLKRYGEEAVEEPPPMADDEGEDEEELEFFRRGTTASRKRSTKSPLRRRNG